MDNVLMIVIGIKHNKTSRVSILVIVVLPNILSSVPMTRILVISKSNKPC